MGKGTANNWFYLGDSFAIAYVCLGNTHESFVSSPNLFLISHAIESYLKGCLMYKFPDENPVVYNHKLFEIFEKLKTDPSFLPEIGISKLAYDAFTISHEDLKPIESKERWIIDKHYSLLLALKYGLELRYFGVGMKRVKGERMGYGTQLLDQAYARFIGGIRNYVNRRPNNMDYWLRLRQSEIYKEFNAAQIDFVNLVIGS